MTSRRHDQGFTLIELVIVIGIMPLVIGAIAAGLISVLSTQASVTNRLGDSGDAQVFSVNFQKDVQGASMITTEGSSTQPAPCGSGTQILGLITSAGSAEVSYNAVQNTNATTYSLYRDTCSLSGDAQSTTGSEVMAHDMPSSIVQTNPVTITCSSSSSICTPQQGVYPYQLNWESTAGLAGVTFSATAPASQLLFNVTAVPLAAVNSTTSSPGTFSTPGGGFATPGTGTYASTLFFVDFTNWNTQTASSGVSCTGGALPMSAPIENTPDILSFCLSTSGTNCDPACTGYTSQSGRTGYNDIAAVPLPTYASPPTSEAYLGNNGFYTGVPGDPALYTIDNGSTAVVKLTNIQVLSSTGVAATGWNLVTGDAESTDSGESITWTTTPSTSVLNLIPNSSTSPVGNACMSTPPTYNSQYLTGIGTTTVECSATVSRDKTGTPMLEAETPSSLTATLVASGLQAIFVGVLL
jgi:hypothetical protein